MSQQEIEALLNRRIAHVPGGDLIFNGYTSHGQTTAVSSRPDPARPGQPATARRPGRDRAHRAVRPAPAVIRWLA